MAAEHLGHAWNPSAPQYCAVRDSAYVCTRRNFADRLSWRRSGHAPACWRSALQSYSVTDVFGHIALARTLLARGAATRADSPAELGTTGKGEGASNENCRLDRTHSPWAGFRGVRGEWLLGLYSKGAHAFGNCRPVPGRAFSIALRPRC